MDVAVVYFQSASLSEKAITQVYSSGAHGASTSSLSKGYAIKIQARQPQQFQYIMLERKMGEK